MIVVRRRLTEVEVSIVTTLRGTHEMVENLDRKGVSVECSRLN